MIRLRKKLQSRNSEKDQVAQHDQAEERHSRESGNPVSSDQGSIPAFAGMTTDA